MIEGRMNYTLMSSLERRALIKTAITLWNHADITALASKICIRGVLFWEKEWQKVEDKVIEKIQELLIPESLKKKLSDIIKPIGFEILRWRKYLDVIYDMERRDYYEDPCTTNTRLVKIILNNLSWTPEGTIDRKKTAEALITHENIHIRKRYKLACDYCFENDILTLLNKIPEMYRNYSYRKDLVVFWTYSVKGEVTRISDVIERKWQGCTPYQYAFEFAASDGNKVATEYFFQKLTPEEREESLVRSAGYACDSHRYYDGIEMEDYGGFLCFLLSQMNEEQQTEVFENYPFSVLLYLLNWPYQSFFMEMAKRILAFLSEEDFDILLRIIVDKITYGFKDYNYQELIRDFWQQSPTTYKQYSVEQFGWGSLLKGLLQAKDKENIKLLLNSATVLDKENIIFSRNILDCCGRLLYNEEMDLLEFFIQECLSSKSIMIKFREEFKRTVLSSCSVEEPEKQNVMFKEFSLLINNLIQKDVKRGLEEGSCGPTKRLCNLTHV